MWVWDCGRPGEHMLKLFVFGLHPGKEVVVVELITQRRASRGCAQSSSVWGHIPPYGANSAPEGTRVPAT
jgi:hypothetical protein